MEDGVRRSPPVAEALCPSCERFIGAVEVCPYCGADSVRRPQLRFLRYASLTLAVLGLLFLYLAAVGRDAPAIRIGDITPFMHYAGVRLAGTVPRPPYVARENGRIAYASFILDDNSGQLRVTADGDVAQGLLDQRRLPAEGARVEATGNLSVAADGAPRLRLRKAEHLRIVQGNATTNTAWTPRTKAPGRKERGASSNAAPGVASSSDSADGE
jgi:hypothetical protein